MKMNAAYISYNSIHAYSLKTFEAVLLYSVYSNWLAELSPPIDASLIQTNATLSTLPVMNSYEMTWKRNVGMMKWRKATGQVFSPELEAHFEEMCHQVAEAGNSFN